MDSKTLRLVGAGGAVVLAAVGGLVYMTRDSKPKPQVIKKGEKSARAARLMRPIVPVPEVRVPLRDIDRAIIAVAAKKPIDPSVNAGDVIPDSPARVQVELYAPADGGGVRAVHIDLERDRKVDEDWAIGKDGAVTRDVSVERTLYHDVWTLDGDSWKLQKGNGATAMVAPRVEEKINLRPVDKQILALAKMPEDSVNTRDAFPGPVKVSVTRGLRKSVQRVQVDLDRDNKIDEVWSMIGGVSRKVSPADDGNYTEEFELQNDHWVRVY